MKNKIYIVSYSVDWIGQPMPIFATESKEKAMVYCAKYNDILQRWKRYYYILFDIVDDGDYDHPLYDRWRQLDEINQAFITEIEIR